MRRPVIAGIAVGAAAVLVAGAIAGVVAYRDATSNIPHATAKPLTAAQLADYRKVVDGWPYPFAPGDAVPKSPPTQSGNPPSLQNDRTFVSSAASGNLKPLQGYFATCTSYQSYRTAPGTGLTVDKPLPAAAPEATPTASTDGHPAAGPGMVGQYQVEIPVDKGPENYATGTVTLDADGHPATYVVAPGDVIDYIAHRFGFYASSGEGFDYLNTVNQVRRGGYPWTIYAGDTLNLSAYTITTIGTINGKVLNEAPPNPMPAQK